MNHELAKTLTTALVQFIDRERPEGSMCCSNTDCANLENAFNSENFTYVEAYMKMKLLGGLTEFENALRQIIEVTLSDEVPNGSGGTMSWAVALSDDDIKKLAPRVLAIAKNELLSFADERNPAIEAIANLERTYFCNPDKLPEWLKNDIARKELNAHTKGYNKGYNDAEKQYNESVEVMKEVSDNVDKTEEELTEFELALRNAMSDTVTLSEDKEDYVISEIADKQAKRYSAQLLALAKKELCRGCNANIEGYIKGREDAEKRYNEGYNKGYEDAEKRYNESVAYHYPEPVPPGAAYKSPQCYTDVMVAPNINSGSSTLKAEG